MNKCSELLKELKRLRIDYDCFDLDTIIQKLGRELIQAECKHLSTETKANSCFYGTYSTTKCNVCGKVLKTDKNW